MEKNKIGLALGSFFAGIHLIWTVLVALIPSTLQTYFNWIFALHGIRPIIVITTMTLMNAIALIIVTFVFGYIIGWLFAWCFSCCECHQKPKRKR